MAQWSRASKARNVPLMIQWLWIRTLVVLSSGRVVHFPMLDWTQEITKCFNVSHGKHDSGGLVSDIQNKTLKASDMKITTNPL